MADAPASLVFKADAFKGDKKFMFTAIKCQNLPDSDGGFNTNDTYLRIRVVGNPTKKTPTIKGSLNPVFKEDNSFIFTGGVGTWVEVICMDWDPESKDDVVIKGTIQLTDEMLKGDEQVLNFQGEDKSGKFLWMLAPALISKIF